MNVKSFADLQDILIEPVNAEDLKGTTTADEDDYGEDFEEADSDFEERRTEQETKEFSIDMRGSEDGVLLQNSRSYSRIEVRKSIESDDGAEARATIKNLENVSVSGSDEDENQSDDIIMENKSDMPASARPEELQKLSDRPDVIEINGGSIHRATAPSIEASVRVSAGKIPQKKSNERVIPEEALILQEKRKQQTPGVKAPTKAFMKMNSKVRVANHWEVPGVSVYESDKVKSTAAGSVVPNSEKEVAYSAKEDREKIVLTVLDLLQQATKKAQSQKEVEVAMKGHAIRIPSVRTGVSKRQALKATGKMYFDNVPDYDPDFEIALDFMRSNDWNNIRASSEIQKTNTYKENLEYNLQESNEMKDSRSEDAKRDRGSTYPAPSRPLGAQRNHKMNATAPGAVQSQSEKNFHPIYGKATGYIDSASIPGATSSQEIPQFQESQKKQQQSKSMHGPPNFEANKDLRAVNSSIENYATWLKPTYLKREAVLASVPAEEAAEVSRKCELLYATFLGDLIQNCKRRADNCSTTEEMAMLRVLAEHVTRKFAAGEPQEDLQCRMIQSALATMPYSDKNKAQSQSFDESVGIPSVSSAGLRENRDRIGGFQNY